MIRQFLLKGMRQVHTPSVNSSLQNPFRRAVGRCALAALLAARTAVAQDVTIDTGSATASPPSLTLDRRFQQIVPTHVALTQSELDARSRLLLIRQLQSEQGFAMRPFPRGHLGLTLAANGKLDPAGEAYRDLVLKEGMAAKPGARLVLTEIKFERAKIVFELNKGPDAKHRFLRHIQLGSGPYWNPVVQGADLDPEGARLTLTFENHLPELTGAQVKALLAPLISFDVKTPLQAYTDTLPPTLKDAILNHRVLVGMDTEMVMFAKGEPWNKMREMDGQMPFEVWIYGKPPEDVEFVRFNGSRVIRMEIARTGETPVVYTKDVVLGLMRTDGAPIETADSNTHVIHLGDVEHNPNTQAPAAPPSLRKPGEKLPADAETGVMKPVQFPDQKPSTQPGVNPDDQPPRAPASQPK